MASIQTLTPGQRYCVVREFIDYNYQTHPVGETWVFERTNFVPYEDGLTVYVSIGGRPVAYRLQWRPEEQAALIENFTTFVVAC
ncbi:DUF3601 domain-containing protein [Hymenobacter sp. H14-R3]|uniref:DUF3601 domain-containing protein n=1 Tax=Hymenobacter sp. H14-R3 TaxID=3046308 RepID=UPI0024BADC9B|nr:DUF3601 domain-containing protein [Hymenobacter sp. H14-R3]MDJ0365928.1 DUF3601 domain-containing protein [Hymenobacter sp. H14-R3]